MPVGIAVPPPRNFSSVLQNAVQLRSMLKEIRRATQNTDNLVANIDLFMMVLHELRQRAPDSLRPDAHRAIIAAIYRYQEILGALTRRIGALETRTRATFRVQAWREFWVFAAGVVLGGDEEVNGLCTQLEDEVKLMQTCLTLSGPRVPVEIEHASSPDDMTLSSEGWVAGTIIQVDLFEGDESLPVLLASSRQVSNGASAAVFAAYSWRGKLALKVFGGITSPEQRLALRRELRNVRTLSHKYILPYIGSAVHELRTILVSPYMENGDMLSYLRTHPDVAQHTLIRQVARAVEYLHEDMRLIHGDLKCENVLISPTGHALLADFGLSTFVDNAHTSTTVTGIRMCYTLSFAAPELLLGQISQETVVGRHRARSKSTQTDVYAFGMLVVQAFIRSSLWPGLLATQIIVNVVSGHQHPRPGGMCDHWWEVCRRCWALNPSERPGIAQIATWIEM